LTNGANFTSTSIATFYGFNPTVGVLQDAALELTLVSGPLTLGPAAVAVPVPEPSSGLLLLVGGALLGLARRLSGATRRPKLPVG
jgi:hypothetical protein